CIPAGDALFDLVFSVDVIQHVSDRDRYFREAARVVNPGGLICTATDSDEDIDRRRPLSSHFPETVAVEKRRYPAIETLAGESAGAGLAEIWTMHAELAYDLIEIDSYRERAFSSLHLIGNDCLRSRNQTPRTRSRP